jgi:hypothetical protein
MNFKKWVKSIQTAGYNGAGTVDEFFSPSDEFCIFYDGAGSVLDSQHYIHPC